MILPEKYCLFCGPQDTVEEAKQYVRDYKLTADDVRIVRTEAAVCVWTKRPVEWLTVAA